MRANLLIIILSLPITTGVAAAGPPATLRVEARLLELPSSKPCRGAELRRVVTRYRVKRVLGAAAGISAGAELFVIHRCPELRRGGSRHTRGSAGRITAGSTHRLTLRASAGSVAANDRFQRRPGPRYIALRTDAVPDPPEMVVKVTGGAGTDHRYSFHQPRLSVGAALDADLKLAGAGIAHRQLRLEVRGDKVAVVPLASTPPTLVDGKPVGRAGRTITYRSAIAVGSYRLRVSLLTRAWRKAMLKAAQR